LKEISFVAEEEE